MHLHKIPKGRGKKSSHIAIREIIQEVEERRKRIKLHASEAAAKATGSNLEESLQRAAREGELILEEIDSNGNSDHAQIPNLQRKPPTISARLHKKGRNRTFLHR